MAAAATDRRRALRHPRRRRPHRADLPRSSWRHERPTDWRSGARPPPTATAILALLATSLGREDRPRYDALFAWKHEENAFGPSPAWVATRRRPARRVPRPDALGVRRRRRRSSGRCGRSTPRPTPTTRAAGSSPGSRSTRSRSCADDVSTSSSTRRTTRAGPATSRWAGRSSGGCRPRCARRGSAPSRASSPPGCPPSGGRPRPRGRSDAADVLADDEARGRAARVTPRAVAALRTQPQPGVPPVALRDPAARLPRHRRARAVSPTGSRSSASAPRLGPRGRARATCSCRAATAASARLTRCRPRPRGRRRLRDPARWRDRGTGRDGPAPRPGPAAHLARGRRTRSRRRRAGTSASATSSSSRIGECAMKLGDTDWCEHALRALKTSAAAVDRLAATAARRGRAHLPPGRRRVRGSSSTSRATASTEQMAELAASGRVDDPRRCARGARRTANPRCGRSRSSSPSTTDRPTSPTSRSRSSSPPDPGDAVPRDRVRRGAAGVPVRRAAGVVGGLRDTIDTGLVTVGSHTHTHALLDRAATDAGRGSSSTRPYELIEDHLGVTPPHFAYPKSSRPPRGRPRGARRGSGPRRSRGRAPTGTARTDPHRLARSPIQAGDEMRWFRAKVAGGMVFEDDVRRTVNRVATREPSRERVPSRRGSARGSCT